MSRTFIIAEAGVNHNGSLDIAMKMVKSAKECGCDCIKFQTFHTENLVTKNAPKAQYQVENTGADDSQFAMLKKLELKKEDFQILQEYCKKLEIEFLSTPFDETSVDLLESLSMKKYKISSGDMTNKPLFTIYCFLQKPMILSTGMSTMGEVREAVEWVEACGNHQISLLHCTSNYPTPYEDVNMNAMLTLKKEFPYPVGYSDHTEGIMIPVMAVAMGAEIIEKHFTLDKTMEGPDHVASLDVPELREMVQAIRNVELARGDGEKPAPNELKTRIAARKKHCFCTCYEKRPNRSKRRFDRETPFRWLTAKISLTSHRKTLDL